MNGQASPRTCEPYPNREFPNVHSCSQGLCCLLFGHFGDEVLSRVGGLCLESCPDRSGDWSARVTYLLAGIIDHTYPNIVTGFLFTKREIRIIQYMLLTLKK